MTDHEENAAIGNLTKQLSDAKRKRSALISELTNIKNTLSSFAHNLGQISTFSVVDAEKIPKMPDDYPSSELVSDRLSELRATCHKITHTQKLLKDAGIDL